jgi:hypothetical protein
MGAEDAVQVKMLFLSVPPILRYKLVVSTVKAAAAPNNSYHILLWCAYYFCI